MLEDEINFQGADIIAAMIMEPILGARGVIPPHPSFMPKVREICARRGILLIADEVTTRFGRSGDWTGARHGGWANQISAAQQKQYPMAIFHLAQW